MLILLFALLLTMDVSVMGLYKYAELALANQPDYYLKLLFSPHVWLGMGISALQLWVWTRILNRTDLSIAYPTASLAYPLTMLMAVLVFHEKLSGSVWVGAGFIVLGVMIIGALSAPEKEQSTPQPVGETQASPYPPTPL